MGCATMRGARGASLALLSVLGVVALHGVGLPAFVQPASAQTVSPSPERQTSTDAVPDLDAIEHQFETLAKRVSPAVVAISGADEHSSDDTAQRAEDLNPDRLGQILENVDRTVGTGLIVDAGGYILTNDHVVGHAEQLWVTTDDKKVYPAIVVGSDPRADLALLKIPATKLPTVTFADPAKTRRGQWAVAIGSPYGLASEGNMCMAVGVVSAMGRSLPKLSGKEDRLYSDLIQTTAQINPGNSGGPLFDLSGNVIGINTAVILPQKQTNGIGFAIPVSPRLLSIVEDLKQGREIVYGYIGAKANTPTSRERKDAGIDGEYGALIEDVEPDSPAAAAGIKVGDIVARVNGELILDGDHFVRLIGAAPINQPLPVKVYRRKQVFTPKVTLKRRDLTNVAVTRESRRLRWRGMLLGPIPANWNGGDGKAVPAGLMVLGMETTSPVAKQGVKVGSVIKSVAKHAVVDVIELQKIISETPAEQCALELAGERDAMASTEP